MSGSVDTLYSHRHHEALQLEVQVLSALIKRNRHSHGRTKYYQRISMALNCLRNKNVEKVAINEHEHIQSSNHNVGQGALSWYDRQCRLQEKLVSVESIVSKQMKLSKRKRKQDDVFWDLIKDETSSDTLSSDVTLLVKDYNEEVIHFFRALTPTLMEILNRIDFAATAMFAEIVRGFFLPFGTIAIGCLARIRSLLLTFSREIMRQTEASEFRLISSLKSGAEVVATQRLVITSCVIELRKLVEKCVVSCRWDPLGSSVTRNKRTAATLQCLGLNGIVPNRNSSNEVQNRNSDVYQDESESSVVDQSGVVTSLQNFNNDESLDKMNKSAVLDVGKAMHASRSDDFSLEKVLTGGLDIQTDCNELDRNATILKSFKTNESLRKNKQKSKKQKKTTSSTTKKSQDKRNDFFDKLFG